MIEHFRSGDCKLNIHKLECPNNCKSQKEFSKAELESHLMKECPEQMMRCIECKKDTFKR
jgi:hypothetical protein